MSCKTSVRACNVLASVCVVVLVWVVVVWVVLLAEVVVMEVVVVVAEVVVAVSVVTVVVVAVDVEVQPPSKDAAESSPQGAHTWLLVAVAGVLTYSLWMQLVNGVHSRSSEPATGGFDSNSFAPHCSDVLQCMLFDSLASTTMNSWSSQAECGMQAVIECLESGRQVPLGHFAHVLSGTTLYSPALHRIDVVVVIVVEVGVVRVRVAVVLEVVVIEVVSVLVVSVLVVPVMVVAVAVDEAGHWPSPGGQHLSSSQPLLQHEWQSCRPL